MNKKAVGGIFIIIVMIIIIVGLVAIFIFILKNQNNNEVSMEEFTWFIKAQSEKRNLTNAQVIITYSAPIEEGSTIRYYSEVKRVDLMHGVWNEISLYQLCGDYDYICAWVWEDYTTYMDKYCFAIRQKNSKVCYYPTENVHGINLNQTHDIPIAKDIGILRFFELENNMLGIESINGSWRTPTVCLDWNIGIITAKLKDGKIIDDDIKDVFKIKNNKCYMFDTTIEENRNITFELEFERLSTLNAYINFTILDMTRDPNNLEDGITNYYFDGVGKDLGGKNIVFKYEVK